jgi:hypothetical protein
MLQDGLYDLSYRTGETSVPSIGYGLASLRNGRILGSDRWAAFSPAFTALIPIAALARSKSV